jgi:glycosyltransferase involved in cell wall biosynthesis
VTSVVIAAHNEATVVGRCLDALLGEPGPDPLDITVVANGCTDATAEVAGARPGVRVIALAEASKPAALNAGDAVAAGFPRVYLDADIVLSGADLHRLTAALDGGRVVAAVPRRRLELTGRPLLVRAYFAVHRHHPSVAAGLFGRGVIALAEAGRARFDRFPDVVADDLFLDSLFTDAEKCEVAGVASLVATPLRTRDLVRRLTRVRAGNAALRAAGRADAAGPVSRTDSGDPVSRTGTAGPSVRPASRWAWLRHAVLPRPWLAPAAACYVGLTLVAALRARRATTAWSRDDSTRAAAG